MKNLNQIIQEKLKDFDIRYDHYNPINATDNSVPAWNDGDYEDMRSFLSQAIREAYEEGRKRPL